MAGTIALVGAGEYLETMAAIDAHLLERVGGPANAHVLVLPTAAGNEDPVRWANMGVGHFERLGASVEPLMVLDKASAGDPAMAQRVRHANFIYLSGGQPGYLLEVLRGSAVWEAIRELYLRGGVLAGCSAGAMVMAEVTRVRKVPGSWNPMDWNWDMGLGLVQGIGVLPHYDRFSDDRIAGVLTTAPNNVCLLGVDEHTAAVSASSAWSVMGQGRVVLWHGGNCDVFRQGDPFHLPEPRGPATML